MKTAFIFSYKGNLAATSDLQSGKFLNDPTQSGQLGVVISSDEVKITQEAKDLLKTAKRDGGSFSEIMLTRHTGQGKKSGESSLGMIGAGKHNFGRDFSIGRDCDLSVVDDFAVVDKEAPEDFKSFIDDSESDNEEE